MIDSVRRVARGPAVATLAVAAMALPGTGVLGMSAASAAPCLPIGAPCSAPLTLPAAPALPATPTLPIASALPTVPGLPAATAAPTLLPAPTLPTASTLPTVPGVPSLPGLPSLPGAPGGDQPGATPQPAPSGPSAPNPGNQSGPGNGNPGSGVDGRGDGGASGARTGIPGVVLTNGANGREPQWLAGSIKASSTATSGMTGTGDDGRAQPPPDSIGGGKGSDIMTITVAIGLVLAALAGLRYRSTRKLRR